MTPLQEAALDAAEAHLRLALASVDKAAEYARMASDDAALRYEEIRVEMCTAIQERLYLLRVERETLLALDRARGTTTVEP